MIILFSLFYIHNIIFYGQFIFFNFGGTQKSVCNIIAIINTALISKWLKKLKNYFTIFVSFFKKTFFYINNNELPKFTGSHQLRNVLTLAAKKQNHRIIRRHLAFQIKILREAIVSTVTYLFIKAFFSL